jgi:hypothetical protein
VTLALALGAASVVVALILAGRRRHGRRLLELAARLEAEGAFESACFHYAVASRAGAKREACEAKVRYLWTAHGPFTFAALGTELSSTFCRYESCGRGFHELTVADIRRLVSPDGAPGRQAGA